MPVLRVALPLALLAVLALTAAAPAGTPALPIMIEANVRGTRVEGMPLGWDDGKIHLLARDGYLWEFRSDEAKDLRKTAPAFRSYSFAELRSALEARAGRPARADLDGPLPGGPSARCRQEVGQPIRGSCTARSSTTSPCAGCAQDARVSADRHRLGIEAGLHQLHPVAGARRAAGLARLLLAADQPDHALRHGRRQAVVDRLAAGRLDDRPRGHAPDRLQHRSTQPVRAAAAVAGRRAGHAVQVPGVFDSQHYPTATDRINRDRLAQFRQYLAHGRKPGSLLALVESDRLFQENPNVAYAESWALAYYLSETQPRNYNAYLAQTAARENFVPYVSAQRRRLPRRLRQRRDEVGGGVFEVHRAGCEVRGLGAGSREAVRPSKKDSLRRLNSSRQRAWGSAFPNVPATRSPGGTGAAIGAAVRPLI